MRIGIDAKGMYPEASGIGRYIVEMVAAIASLPAAMEHEFILYPGKNTRRIKLPANWRYSERRIISSGTLRAFLYPLAAKSDNLNLFYSADFIGPVLKMPCKCVTTVHDLIPIVYPELTTLKHRFVGRHLLPVSIKNADIIISVSNATKNDILKYVNISENKIRVIYEGKNRSFHPLDDAGISRKILSEYGLDNKSYILFLGSLDPKKNLANVISAFSRIDARVRKDCKLVLAGNIPRDNPELKKIADKLNTEGRIIFTGFINDGNLSTLYNNARAFCFPSFYEGFGLPVLEAMSCGCPVITSDVSSLPEVTGDAAILVNPDDPGQIAGAMTRLITDDALFNNLKEKGLDQADKFSWEKAAGELLKIFNSI